MMTHTTLNVRPIPTTFLDALTQALTSERRLIDELTQVILRQREAVGVDDLPAVNDSVFATHRLLIALSEVRKRRRSLSRLFGYSEKGSATSTGVAAGSRVPPQLRKEQQALRQAARELSKEIGINRRLLRRLLGASDSEAPVVH